MGNESGPVSKFLNYVQVGEMAATLSSRYGKAETWEGLKLQSWG